MSRSILFLCPRCAKPVCQRAYTMNLAFGFAEDQYCLNCLAKELDQDTETLFRTGLEYVRARTCFQEAWDKLKSPGQCPLPGGGECMYQLCFAGQ
ncbi:MAG: hypothetical protein SFT81_01365 [Candidatus Caenarcaniphilales bacterium]|nr:hypothetical protein [Candidatus Caenarcaniphilales bacterium]